MKWGRIVGFKFVIKAIVMPSTYLASCRRFSER
jgi:hypothetical protein